MNKTKMSMTLAILAWALLATGALATSFENFRPLSLELSNANLVPSNHIHTKMTRSVDNEGPKQRCGVRLLETLKSLCGGPSHVRRSDPGMSWNGMLEDSVYSNAEGGARYMNEGDSDNPLTEYQDTDFVWNRNPKLLALKLLSEGKGHQRFRRNVIEECCKRPCTQSHMLRYC